MLRECGAVVDVVNIEEAVISECNSYDKILLSPGPELPKDYPVLFELIENRHKNADILGICLGHQAIGSYFGMSLKQLDFPKHGIKSKILVTRQDIIYNNLPKEFFAGRYHSWVLEDSRSNSPMAITATDERGDIMSISHKKDKIRGIQYHPESIMTESGKIIISNWINS
jgi:anthranilate synthase component 2